MGNNPINLALRFILELVALFALGLFGWTLGGGGPLRFVWAILFPLAAAAAWAVFRVPGDGGPPVVQVPGVVRLLIEIAVFGGAVWAWSASGRGLAAWIFGVIVVFHYIISLDRLAWLVRQ